MPSRLPVDPLSRSSTKARPSPALGYFSYQTELFISRLRVGSKRGNSGAFHRFIVLLALLLATAPLSSSSAAPPKNRATRPKPGLKPGLMPGLMSVKEVRPHMKGYAVTVFQGTKSERFAVELLDVVPDFATGMDVVLFRATDPRLKHSGIVGGMSGSPVYVNGKLLGAIAYGYAFNKDPVGGITPIEAMLEIDRLPYRPDVQMRAGGWYRDQRRVDQWLDPNADPLFFRRLPQQATSAAGALQPLETPLGISGFGARSSRFLGEYFGQSLVRSGSGRGLATSNPVSPNREIFPLRARRNPSAQTRRAPQIQGQNSRRSKTKPAPSHRAKVKKKRWAPGDSISVVLIEGDNAAASNGTVTWVGGPKNERLLAYGHPMQSMGATELPIADAHVHVIISSVQRSFKMASPLTIQGTMVQDRQPAIAVRTNVTAPMVPVTTTVTGAEKRLRGRSYHNRVALHPDITPALIASILIDATEEAASDQTHVVIRTEHEIDYQSQAGRKTLRFDERNFFIDGIDPRRLGRSRAMMAIATVLYNRFEVAKLLAVRQRVSVTYGAPVEQIEGITLRDGEIRAGELLRFDVILRHELTQQKRRYPVQLRIPKHCQGQRVTVQVAGGQWVQPYRPVADSVDAMLDTLASTYPEQSLVLSLFTPEEGLSTKHGLLDRLPQSVLSTLDIAGSTQRPIRFKHAARRVLPQSSLIEGTQELSFDVLPPLPNR